MLDYGYSRQGAEDTADNWRGEQGVTHVALVKVTNRSGNESYGYLVTGPSDYFLDRNILDAYELDWQYV